MSLEQFGVLTIVLAVCLLSAKWNKKDIDIANEFPGILADPAKARVAILEPVPCCEGCGAEQVKYQVVEVDNNRRVSSVIYRRSDESNGLATESIVVWKWDRCSIILYLANNIVFEMKRIGVNQIQHPKISHQEYEEIFDLIRRVRNIAQDPLTA